MRYSIKFGKGPLSKRASFALNGGTDTNNDHNHKQKLDAPATANCFLPPLIDANSERNPATAKTCNAVSEARKRDRKMITLLRNTRLRSSE